MSKILLLGGTGAMGVYLSEILATQGHAVVVTSRKPRANTTNVTYRVGNARDDAFLRTCISEEQPDAIVDFMIYNTQEFAKRAPWILDASKHYLFLSSYRVFNESVPLTERSPRLLDSIDDPEYLKTDEYGLTKARQENLLRAEVGKHTGHWTILRPGITYSKARFQFGCLEANVVCYRSFRGLPLVMPDVMLDKRTTLTWGRDVAEMIARLILNPKAYEEDFIVASGENHTWREIFALYQANIGATLKICSLKDYIRFAAGRAQVLYDRMFDRVIDNRKVLEATGLRQEDLAPVNVALTRELQAFRDHPDYPSSDIARNARIDRLCGVKACDPRWTLREKLAYWKERYPAIGQNILVRALLKSVRHLTH